MALNSKIPSGPVEEKWEKHKFDMKLVNPANKRKYSVIVVGSGLAGGSAAATLAELPAGFFERNPAASGRSFLYRFDVPSPA